MKMNRFIITMFLVLVVITFTFPPSDEAETVPNLEHMIDARQKYFGGLIGKG
ncbi:hypothetical protein [Pradoshia sp.]|uniref:hypothetical protein n=1 Tax=Pradoshia sp. TaxID=2651281 RepID=UPI003F059136